MVNITDFKNIEIKVGQIKSVERVEGSEKLLKLLVDLGEPDLRQVLAGIGPYFEDVSVLVGKKAAFVANLEPRNLMGHESQGMILAASDKDKFSLLEVSQEISVGTRIS